jgi:hypothetical protein
MLTAVEDILRRCGTSAAVMPPTMLFNEGWLLRLVLGRLDKNRGVAHPLALEPNARWYSEALLPSRFLPTRRGDPLAESFTHADGVVGHFTIEPGIRGDAVLHERAEQFVVAEAKLGSVLGSKGRTAFALTPALVPDDKAPRQRAEIAV